MKDYKLENRNYKDYRGVRQKGPCFIGIKKNEIDDDVGNIFIR
jgi:hypothetical protein